METHPIIIRIQVIDEATAKINAVASSLKNLEIKMPEMSLGGSYKQVNVIKSSLRSALTPLQTLEKETANFQRQFGMMDVEPVERLDQTLKEAGMTQGQFTNFLKRNNMEVIKGVGVYDKLSGSIVSQGQAVKLATIYSRRFKMEWLSIMFAGMALERVFHGIVKSQMDLYGITQMTSDMWTIVMAPAMDLVSQGLYDIIDKIMQLPESTQMTIGLIVLGGDVFAKIVGALGQIFLAIMGLKMLFPGLVAAVARAGGGMLGIFKAIGAVFAGLSATFLIVAAIIVAVLIGMYLAWKTNFLNMKETVQNFIDGIKQWFHGIIEIVKGVLMIIKGIFTGDFTLIKDGIVKIFKGLWDFLVGGFKAAFNLIAGIIKGALMIVYNIIKVLIDGVIWLVNAIGKVAGKKTDIIKFRMPTFQQGGIMPYTGIAYLHAGEKVIPKNQVNSSESTIVFSPTVNLNASVSSDMDVRDLASKLNYY